MQIIRLLLILPFLQNSFFDRLNEAIKISDEGNYPKAIELLHDIIDDAQLASEDSILTYSYIKLGSALCKANKCELGVAYFSKALNKSNQLNNSSLKSSALFGLAAAYQLLNKYDSSLIYYEQTVPLFQINNDSTTLSYLFSNLGMLHSKLGDYNESKVYFSKAKDIQLIQKNYLALGDTYYNLGLANFQMGEIESGLINYKLALKYYSDDESVSKTLKAIGKAFYELNVYDSSSYYYFQFDSLNHDILHSEYEDKILELETKFKTAEIERDNALKQAEIEKNKRELTILYIFSFFLIIISIAIYYILNQRRKRIKIASEKAIQDLLSEQESKATSAILAGQDKERKRIAAELHDNLGSILVTLNMYADSMQSKDKKDIPALAEKISEVAQLANEETRKISHSLYSGMLKHFGLEAAIKQLTEAVSSARNIQFKLSLQIDKIPSDAGLEIYRIIQELVNNTLKHAECTRVHLEITHIDQSINIIFEDNGIGFNKNEFQAGLGLKNIENRVEKLEGELTIDSKPGKGSTFIIEIPNL
ncbi:tetratricopeptide repeat-containing sensor histidine kinase [Ekhidna sp.]|uniref:tetratricopeptide repeat-containing sensor histidine kinase n=1 Tax=Ekhidna sp. TaxID=2608089 RepID=UPI003B50690A